MKLRKVMAVLLACSMILGQTAWAAEPQEAVQEKAGAAEDVTVSVETEEEEEQNLPEQEELISLEKDSALETLPDNEENVQTQEAASEGQADMQELVLYTDYDRFINIACGDWSSLYTEYEIQIEDESVCKAEISDKNNADLIIKFQPLKQGSTQVKIFKTGQEDTSISYTVNVRELPGDAVPFEDAGLRSALFQTSGAPSVSVDENGDGYISKSELESVTDLRLRSQGIASLRGLEYASDLRVLDLTDNPELTDVDALFQLEGLESLWMTGTNVSDEDRWNLAGFKDFEIDKGDSVNIPSGSITSGFAVFESDSDLLIEASENGELVKLTEPSYALAGKSFTLTALEQGEAKLKITYGENFVMEVTVTIHGIDSAQEVGETYTEPVEIKRWGYDDANYMANMVVLTGNGDLWETCPEVQLIKKNVKDCQGDYYIDGSGKTIRMRYILDQNNDLWNEDEKIASDVQKCVLVHTVNSGIDVYILKNDGTLWQGKDGSFTKTADSIAELYGSGTGYLSVNGDWYHYGETVPYLREVKKVIEGTRGETAYYGMDGCLYLEDKNTGSWNSAGKIDIDVQDFIKTDFGCLILSEAGELYECTPGGRTVKQESGIKAIYSTGYYTVEECICKKTDGSYFFYEVAKEGVGEKKEFSGENPYRIAGLGNNSLYYTASGNDGIVKRNDVEILDHVTDIWMEDFDREFALRTDGTVWDITGVPKMILDLKTGTYVKGDVNEDGEVNIEDLRIILRSVCGKIDLTERQIQIADVAEDGMVDIQDLRKVLRYVCGKITEL